MRLKLTKIKREIEMQITFMPIDTLIPYHNNPRINIDAVKKVKASIQEFGFKNPILIDDRNYIIAGHTRLLAARELEIKEIPVIKITDLTDAQRQAYRIADNRVAQESKWDNDLLKLELTDLAMQGFDLESTGFDQDELDKLLNTGSPTILKDAAYKSQFEIVISCENSQDQEEVLKFMTDRGYQCK